MRSILFISSLLLAGCAPALPTYTPNAQGVVAELRQGEATLEQAQRVLGRCAALAETPSHAVTAKWAFRDSDSTYTFVELAFGPDGRLERKAVSTATYGYP